MLEYLGEAPELEVVYDLTEIRRCDVIVFVYPIWFGGPPAMIKGYVDRVLGAGFKPSHDHAQAHNPFLKGRHMISFSTSASTQAWLGEQGQLTSLRDGFDRYLGTIFQLAATEHVHIEAVVEGLSKQYAAEQLELVREAARKTCATALEAAHRAEMARLTQGETPRDAAPKA